VEDGRLPGYTTRCTGVSANGNVEQNLRRTGKTITALSCRLVVIQVPNVALTDETGSPHYNRYSDLVVGTSRFQTTVSIPQMGVAVDRL
jgi:hypothetical protein